MQAARMLWICWICWLLADGHREKRDVDHHTHPKPLCYKRVPTEGMKLLPTLKTLLEN